MWYGLSIIFCAIMLALVNVALNGLLLNLPVWYIFLAVLFYVVAVVAIDGLFALIIRRLLPKKWFSYQKKIFQVGKRERKFYEKIGIRKWKDKILELGMFTAFSKSKVASPDDNEYIERFLLESNYGFIIHVVGMIAGFLLIFINLRYALMFALPVAVINLFYNFLSTAILRYNVPRLMALHIRNERKTLREKEQSSSSVA